MRLIDADALLEISDVFIMHTKEYGSLEVISVDAVGDAPTVDAVPVVRCQECKKHSETNGKHYCKFWRMHCSDDSDFFCKAGEQGEGVD